jgi:hypothetical protein
VTICPRPTGACGYSAHGLDRVPEVGSQCRPLPLGEIAERPPVVPFTVGGGPSCLHLVVLPGFHERPYLVEGDGGDVAIEVGSEGAASPQYLELVTPIIESLQVTI